VISPNTKVKAGTFVEKVYDLSKPSGELVVDFFSLNFKKEPIFVDGLLGVSFATTIPKVNANSKVGIKFYFGESYTHASIKFEGQEKEIEVPLGLETKKDDEPKEKEMKPFHLVMCLDNSGSMAGSRWNALMDCVKKILSEHQNGASSESIVSIILYDGTATTPVKFEPITQKDSIFSKISFRGGGTDYANALTCAQEVLVSNDNTTYVPVLLFLSDGECGNGDREMEVLKNTFSSHGLQIYVIGFGNEVSRLQDLAKLGGGKYFDPKDNLGLMKVFEEISDELSRLVNGSNK